MKGWFVLLRQEELGLKDWTIEPDRHFYEYRGTAEIFAKKFLNMGFETGIAPADIQLGGLYIIKD